MLKIIKWLFILVCLVVVGGVAYYSLYPDIGQLKKVNPRKTAFMEYREREAKAKGKNLRIQHKWVKFSNISPYMVKAVIIAEDDKFWSHQGFDFDAIEKAIEKDIKRGAFKYGGSTISQQLAKNLYLSPSRNPARKLAEALLTWRLERTLSKRRILELYLNVAEWGEGVFGVEAASHRYYGKPAALLSAEEAARLAAVLPNPRKYLVSSSSRFVQKRTDIIYSIMVRRGIVVPEYEEIIHEADQPATITEGEDH